MLGEELEGERPRLVSRGSSWSLVVYVPDSDLHTAQKIFYCRSLAIQSATIAKSHIVTVRCWERSWSERGPAWSPAARHVAGSCTFLTSDMHTTNLSTIKINSKAWEFSILLVLELGHVRSWLLSCTQQNIQDLIITTKQGSFKFSFTQSALVNQIKYSLTRQSLNRLYYFCLYMTQE